MRKHFPVLDAAKAEWTNIVERSGTNQELLERVLSEHIDASEVLVEVHRKIGAMVPRHEAAAYISSHLGQGEIRVADREFTSFVVVAQNGVVTGWRRHDG